MKLWFTTTIPTKIEKSREVEERHMFNELDQTRFKIHKDANRTSIYKFTISYHSHIVFPSLQVKLWFTTTIPTKIAKPREEEARHMFNELDQTGFKIHKDSNRTSIYKFTISYHRHIVFPSLQMKLRFTTTIPNENCKFSRRRIREACVQWIGSNRIQNTEKCKQNKDESIEKREKSQRESYRCH